MEAVSWETRPAVVGGWRGGGFGRGEEKEQEGLEIEIKLHLKRKWEGTIVEEVWWDQTVTRIGI